MAHQMGFPIEVQQETTRPLLPPETCLHREDYASGRLFPTQLVQLKMNWGSRAFLIASSRASVSVP
eukprot:scaffold14274_cov215-Skeletonema_marinoi.AAC.20